MAVLVSDSNNPDYDGKLSTANGFYRAEAYNAALYNNTNLLLTTPRYINVTFANSGNCQGIVLAIYTTSTTESNSITVTLQENVEGNWTDRATVTYTIDQITAAPSGYRRGNWVVPFKGGTFPYAVDTDADKWRFKVFASAGTHYLKTSNGTDPFYVAWCDNAVSFNDNDALVVADPVVIDKSCTFKGVLGTGDTTRAMAIMICRSLTPGFDTVSLLTWENPPADSYTMTVDGVVWMSTMSGFRIGTEDSPIPADKPAYLEIISPPVGSSTGFFDVRAPDMMQWFGRNGIFFYGEYPSVMRTTLSAQANSGQKVIQTTDTTGWQVGDWIAIGRESSGIDTNHYVIDSISDKTITVTSNLSQTRLSGASVVLTRGSGFGVYINYTSNAYDGFSVGYVRMRGCCIKRNGVSFVDVTHGYNGAVDPPSYRGESYFEYCSRYTDTVSYGYVLFRGYPPIDGVRVENCVFHRCLISITGSRLIKGDYVSGAIKLYNNCSVLPYHTSTGYYGTFYTAGANLILDVQNNVFESTRWTSFISIGGIQTIFKNNSFFGHNYSFGEIKYGAVTFTTLINPIDISGNVFNNCKPAIELYSGGTTIKALVKNNVFGNIVANAVDIFVDNYSYIDFEFYNTSGLTTFSNLSAGLSSSVPGSKLAFSSYNGSVNDHRNYLTYGNIVSTGDGLADTTVHTSGTGKFAVRFESTSSENPLEWSFTVPTGNIQNKTMTVAVWCKINSASYYGGTTYQMPRLTVDYDNGTTTYSEATQTTGWQLISVNFTPTTSYGEIIVTLSTKTDATGSNAYVYFDDFAVLYPAGYALDLGGMDLWANALPVVPPIATVLSAKDVWTALDTENYGSNTMGERIKKLLKTTDFLALK